MTKFRYWTGNKDYGMEFDHESAAQTLIMKFIGFVIGGILINAVTHKLFDAPPPKAEPPTNVSPNVGVAPGGPAPVGVAPGAPAQVGRPLSTSATPGAPITPSANNQPQSNP